MTRVEQQLTDLREGLYNALGGVSPSDAELIEVARLGRDARAELATLRGALEARDVADAAAVAAKDANSACDDAYRRGESSEERLRLCQLAMAAMSEATAKWNDYSSLKRAALATPPRRTPITLGVEPAPTFTYDEIARADTPEGER
jgi:hypothetical protein